MKAKIITGLVIILLVFSACVKKDDGVDGSTAGQKGADAPLISSFNAIDGIYHYVGTKSESADGTVTIMLDRDTRTKLYIAEPITSTGETVSFEDSEYIQINNSEDKEFYIKSQYFLGNAILGVITGEKTVLYKKPNNINTTSLTIPRMTIVTMSSASENGFFEIVAYDEGERTSRYNLFVREGSVSKKEADVQSALLYVVAASKKSETEKKELLSTAADDYGSSIFYSEISDALAELEAAEDAVLSEGMEPSADQVESYDNLSGKINDNNVNVREFPGTNSSILPETLNEGDSVKITIVTKAKYKADGYADNYWFKIEEPEGWVFGEFIDIGEE